MKVIVKEVGVTIQLTVDELAEVLGFTSRDELHDSYGRGTQAIGNAIRETWKPDEFSVTEE